MSKQKNEVIDLIPSMKTAIILECSDREWRVRYTGSMDGSNLNDKKTAKHDQRILMALASDHKLFDLINRLVVPAQRYYRREARKAAKNNAQN